MAVADTGRRKAGNGETGKLLGQLSAFVHWLTHLRFVTQTNIDVQRADPVTRGYGYFPVRWFTADGHDPFRVGLINAQTH